MIIETNSELYRIIRRNWHNQTVNYGLRDFSDWVEQYNGMIHVNRNFQHRYLLSDEAGIVPGVDCICFERERDYFMFLLRNI